MLCAYNAVTWVTYVKSNLLGYNMHWTIHKHFLTGIPLACCWLRVKCSEGVPRQEKGLVEIGKQPWRDYFSLCKLEWPWGKVCLLDSAKWGKVALCLLVFLSRSCNVSTGKANVLIHRAICVSGRVQSVFWLAPQQNSLRMKRKRVTAICLPGWGCTPAVRDSPWRTRSPLDALSHMAVL